MVGLDHPLEAVPSRQGDADGRLRRVSDPSDRPTGALDVRAIHAAHAGFVWATLHRMGVPDSDRADLLQEVFLVVHRRLDSYDRSSLVTTWLYGICLRVVSTWRRHRRRHPEDPVEVVPEAPPRGRERSPEDAAASAQARALVGRVLDGLDADKRAVFVMFELEEFTCPEIAAMTGVPVGTVYSRLHAARAAFAERLAALQGPPKGGDR